MKRLKNSRRYMGSPAGSLLFFLYSLFQTLGLACLVIGVVWGAFWSCKPHKGGESQVERYIENDVLWALGQVELSDSAQLPDVYIRKISNSLGSSPSRSGGVQSLVGYQLVGQSGGDEKALALVDYHPTDNKLLAYIYSLQVAPSSGDEWVLYAKLLKTPQKANRNILIVGQIKGPLEGELIRVQLGNHWHRSLIDQGPLLGAWALHVPEVRHIEVKPWVGLCPRDQDFLSRPDISQQKPAQGQLPPHQGNVQGSVAQSGSGAPQQSVGQTSQSPLQGPSQADSCRLVQMENDLCGGNPLQSGCIPRYDDQVKEMLQVQEARFGRVESVEQLQPIEGQQYGYHLVQGGERGKFYLRFQGVKIEKEDENDRICRLGILVTARTLGGQLNPACRISVLPSMTPAVNGAAKVLRCGFQIEYLNPQSYLEKICQMWFQVRLPVTGSQSPMEKQIEDQAYWSALQVIHR